MKGGGAAPRRGLEKPTVFARVRPPAESGGHALPPEGEAHKYGACKRYDGHTAAGVVIADRHGKEVFGFPRRVFGDCTSQEEVYNELAAGSVRRFIRGEANGLVFAYGQTGTGKTHTILGPEHSWGSVGHTDAGIFPRAAASVFEHFSGRASDFTLHASALEFYIATGHDLLEDGRPAIGFTDGHEPLGHSLWRIRGPEDLIPFMRKVQRNRTTRSTHMNTAKSGAGVHSGSSRSHAAVILTLRQSVPGGKVLKSSLHCVDMAGAERVSSTGAERCSGLDVLFQCKRGEELTLGAQAFIINFELSNFRTEIKKAAAAHRRGKEPFVSKCLTTAATEYFSQCLTGACSVAAVVCISPAPQNGWESWFACHYGEDIAKLRVPVAPPRPRALERAIQGAEATAVEAAKGSGGARAQARVKSDFGRFDRFALRRSALVRQSKFEAAALRELQAQLGD